MKTTRYTLRGIFKMKVLVQRVKKASVVIQDETVGEINKGFLLYVCFEANDTMEKLDKAVTKILNLRIFEDSKAKMNQNKKAQRLAKFINLMTSQNGRNGQQRVIAIISRTLP